jgi:hypothetical protein
MTMRGEFNMGAMISVKLGNNRPIKLTRVPFIE